jgi:hypothetical protein
VAAFDNVQNERMDRADPLSLKRWSRTTAGHGGVQWWPARSPEGTRVMCVLARRLTAE